MLIMVSQLGNIHKIERTTFGYSFETAMFNHGFSVSQLGDIHKIERTTVGYSF